MGGSGIVKALKDHSDTAVSQWILSYLHQEFVNIVYGGKLRPGFWYGDLVSIAGVAEFKYLTHACLHSDHQICNITTIRYVFFLLIWLPSHFQRSIVEVEWSGSGKMNIYRAGHKGKVVTKLDYVWMSSSFVIIFCITGGHQVQNCWGGQPFLPGSLAHTWYVVDVIQCLLWYHYNGILQFWSLVQYI